MFWLALAGMAANAIGQQQGTANTVKGAQTQADIEAMNREAQQRRFDKQIAMQKPFYEAGTQAIPLYDQAINNKLDVTASPLYKMQAELMGNAGKVPDYVREGALEKLGATEGQKIKGRLADLQQVGLGASGSAGKSAVNFGSAFGDSLSRGYGALAQGTAQSAMQRQNMWTGAMEGLSGYPALAYQNRYLNQPNYSSPGKMSAPTNPPMMYAPSKPNIGGY